MRHPLLSPGSIPLPLCATCRIPHIRAPPSGAFAPCWRPFFQVRSFRVAFNFSFFVLISCNLRGACRFENVDELRETAGYLGDGRLAGGFFSSQTNKRLPEDDLLSRGNLRRLRVGQNPLPPKQLYLERAAMVERLHV